VLIDPEKARGQRALVRSCPYGVIYWNEAADTAQKCTFCAHLLDEGWKQPRCVEVCPTQALVFGDLNDGSSAVAARMAEPAIEELRPEWQNRPLVRYIGLPKRLVCGEVVLGDKPEEPAAGVTVTLRCGAEVLAAATDSYGDFEFTAVKPNEQYLLQISHPGYAPREITVSTRADADLGAVQLDRI
jgi:ferredoxin